MEKITKQELEFYGQLVEKRNRLEKRIRDKEKKLTSIRSPQITNDPLGGERSDFTDAVIEIEDLRAELHELDNYCDFARERNKRHIALVKDGDDRDILECRYIKLLTWEESAEELHRSQSAIEKRFKALFLHRSPVLITEEAV